MGEWKEILSDNEEQTSDEDLLKYLDENTSEEEKYLIEKKLSKSSFESDAAEGLQKIKEPGHLQSHVNQLNKKLHQQLAFRKRRKEKGKVIKFRWILLAILILLFICTIGYVIIRLHNRNSLSHDSLLPKTELKR